MLESKEVYVIFPGSNINYYQSKGYDVEILKRPNKRGQLTIPKGSRLLVKIEDLPLSSNVYVDVRCDYCGKMIPNRTYNDYNIKLKNSLVNTDCCNGCKGIKIEESCQVKYGVNNPMQLEKFKTKSKNTSFKKYGVFHFAKLESSRLYLRNIQREEYTKVKKDFEDANFTLLITKDEYENSSQFMKCICNNHPNIIQYKKYQHLKDNHICKYCYYENNHGENNPSWNGGVTEINKFLRSSLTTWKKSSMQNSNFKCVITNKHFDVIHHLYSFDQILQETFKETNLPIYQQIKDYTQDELNTLSNKCIELHNKYPLGVCLTKEVHELFHKISNYGLNTPEQFYEFQQRYNNGEFTSFLSA